MYLRSFPVATTKEPCTNSSMHIIDGVNISSKDGDYVTDHKDLFWFHFHHFRIQTQPLVISWGYISLTAQYWQKTIHPSSDSSFIWTYRCIFLLVMYMSNSISWNQNLCGYLHQILMGRRSNLSKSKGATTIWINPKL